MILFTYTESEWRVELARGLAKKYGISRRRALVEYAAIIERDVRTPPEWVKLVPDSPIITTGGRKRTA